MGDILRRRGMMAQAEEANDLLYSLYNHTDNSQINTQIPVMQQDLSTTIAMDITIASNPTSGDYRTYRLFYVWNADSSAYLLGIGKYNRTQTELRVWWQAADSGSNTVITGSTAAAGRKRFVVTHEANSNVITVYSKMADGTVNSQTKSATFTATTNKLYITSSSATSKIPPNSTIHSFEIYNRIWTAAERDAFFAD